LQAVVFCGIQGAGKSSFYRERFADTHVRINLDMLRTRKRERILLEACLAARQPFVVDNTNPTAADRARYLVPATVAGFEVVAYCFRPSISEALALNAGRQRQVPPHVIVDTADRLELPRLDEGFAALYAVAMDGTGGFVVEKLDGQEPTAWISSISSSSR
jgi:predicted kinase